MPRTDIDIRGIDFSDIDLTDSKPFADRVPHEWFAFLRKNAPVWWQEESDGPGFWAVTSHADCTTVNRDYEHFSSHKKATFIWELPEDQLVQQQLVMLNMDPPLHTRYRRLVNKGFTPRMVNQLHERIHVATDGIIDSVIEQGKADFVTDIAAELPLIVIAELLGVPDEDRHRMFDWSNRMIGNEDPEYQQNAGEAAQQASLELYAYASELFGVKRANPHDDLMSVLTEVEVEGEKLSDFELELFFLLLTVAGNETTRNLISGAMVFFHISANRDETVFDDPQRFDITRNPNPHLAFGAGGPHFCLGANLARMEIRVMFEHILDRMPDLQLDGEVERLQSQFISGVKHIPVAFPPAARVS
jgi:cholest-4-en-3-one 26-monooxygenase